MKISVIMPSFLGEYDGCAKDQAVKMKRAIQSFLAQDYADKELIVVCDGCTDSYNLMHENFNGASITIVFIEKQKLFSGYVRQAGLESATGNIITYLDNDDVFNFPDHLSTIVEGFEKPKIKWVYFNDFVKMYANDTENFLERNAVINHGQIGTSNIAHRNLPNISWEDCDGYGHDFMFIKRLEFNYPKFKKITGPSYLVCHLKGSVDN